jgi:hypothetical protein
MLLLVVGCSSASKSQYDVGTYEVALDKILVSPTITSGHARLDWLCNINKQHLKSHNRRESPSRHSLQYCISVISKHLPQVLGAATFIISI